MNPLYAMFIYPLELVYHFVYSLCYTITGNYGVGLIVLSCLAAIGYLPLGRLALKAQHKEKQLSALLKPKLDKIKAEETDGSKRQLRTSNLYKKYRYHPFLAIRSAFGVILQLPFLLGAYYMISNFTALEGQSFLFISDLNKPDGLLGGVNFLPFLMTAINICTTLTTPKLSIKDRTQAFIIAGGFLWLLYSAPSALLFFWTTNNLIFLVQNLIARIKTKNNEPTTPPVKLTLSRWNQAILATTSIYGLYTTFIYIKKYMELKEIVLKPFILNLSIEIALAYISICITFWAVWKIIIQTKSHNKIFFASVKIISVLMLWTPSFYFFRHLVKNDKLLLMGAINYGLYTLIFLTNFFLILISIDTKKITAFFNTIFHKKTHKPFFTSLAILFILFFFYHVAMFYKSDASYFTDSLFTAYSKIFPLALVCFGCITLIYYFLNQYWKYITTSVVIFSLFLSLLNLFIFKGNYGALDLNLLSNPVFFTLNQFAMDMIAFFIASTTLVLLYKYKMIEKYNNAALLFLVATIVITTFVSIPQKKKTTPTTEVVTDEQTEKLLEQYYGLSKTEPNVIIFIFDMFTGGHMEELLERNSNFWNDLDGFTWYPDTVALSQYTATSLPSIYGGYNYTPEAINSRKNFLIKEINAAYTELPNQFSDIDFEVTLNTPAYFLDDAFFYKKIAKPDNVLLLDPDISLSQFYKEYLFMETISNNSTALFLTTSAFSIIPHTMKHYLYNQGKWLGITKDVNTITQTLQKISSIKMFAEQANTTRQKPTLKIHYNELSHVPFYLKEKELKIVQNPTKTSDWTTINGIVPSHLYTEEHIINFAVEYIEKLKQLGVYNNTKIIITSDHCWADSVMLQKKLGGNISPVAELYTEQVYPGRPHGLLLFKDFNTQGKLEISTDLMTTADTYYLAQKDIFPEQKQDNSIRYHYVADTIAPSRNEKKFSYQKFAVKGSMFNLKNWDLSEGIKKKTH
ncbi:MAG: YidC/Oxa1 family membrane protein insertase [Treponemataceae bacterium]